MVHYPVSQDPSQLQKISVSSFLQILRGAPLCVSLMWAHVLQAHTFPST